MNNNNHNSGDHDSTQQQYCWRVMKFGGTSVSKGTHWSMISEQIKQLSAEGKQVMLVVSAVAGVTNQLSELLHTTDTDSKRAIVADIEAKHLQLMQELGLERNEALLAPLQELTAFCDRDGKSITAKYKAGILSWGERLSSQLAWEYLKQQGIDIALQDARRLLRGNSAGLEVDDYSWLSAGLAVTPEQAVLNQLAQQAPVHITQGFVVGSESGDTMLLGRGGSDTSGALLAAALDAELYEIWTDVSGLYSADPRVVPQARVLKRVNFEEAQELAFMGAKVLHPRCLQPLRQAGISARIRNTLQPSEEGTLISAMVDDLDAHIKGIVSRSNITLITLEGMGMWHRVGFLADIFAIFKAHGLSVDLIATSESSVSVTLDPATPALHDSSLLQRLRQELERYCQVGVVTGCVSISLVGKSIRTLLGRLSSALDLFQDRRVHMVTQSANDLNLTLVVDPEQADWLVRKLHRDLIELPGSGNPLLLDASAETPHPAGQHGLAFWWQAEAEQISQRLAGRDCAYVYHLPTVAARGRQLQEMQAVDRVFYAMKANPHEGILKTIHGLGLGFECVSIQEVEQVLAVIPDLQPGQVLFTPNFAPRSEYRKALEYGVNLTVDSVYPLTHWPELFQGQAVLLRIDLAEGHGHHQKVITAGHRSKFGIPLHELEQVAALAERHGIRIKGLHTHSGSGVLDAGVWQAQLRALLSLRARFPDAELINIGGGLGVGEAMGEPGLDIRALDQALTAVKKQSEPFSLCMEPGRFLAAECGILAARVTQVKRKGNQHYLGLATGMNSLIRPALYGSHHPIVNLSRLGEPAKRVYTVVGPLCESGDILGESRYLPESEEGDLMAIINSGAYGASMASHYNLRPPAETILLGTN